jgi:hypothetical protein
MIEEWSIDERIPGQDVILDLCGGSGRWSDPYKKKGYEVRLLTLPTDIRFLDYDISLQGRVRGILAAPPCRTWTNASNGVHYSIGEQLEACSVVDACLRAVVLYQPSWWALENPPGRLKKLLGPRVFTFQPWWYGDARTKYTNLWGHFSIPKRTCWVRPEGCTSTGCTGQQGDPRRSMTPAGFANAFCEANP